MSGVVGTGIWGTTGSGGSPPASAASRVAETVWLAPTEASRRARAPSVVVDAALRLRAAASVSVSTTSCAVTGSAASEGSGLAPGVGASRPES